MSVSRTSSQGQSTRIAANDDGRRGPNPFRRVAPAAAGEPLSDFGRLFLAGQALPPAANRGDELRQVDLKRVEDLVGVVLGAEADLTLAGRGPPR